MLSHYSSNSDRPERLLICEPLSANNRVDLAEAKLPSGCCLEHIDPPLLLAFKQRFITISEQIKRGCQVDFRDLVAWAQAEELENLDPNVLKNVSGLTAMETLDRISQAACLPFNRLLSFFYSEYGYGIAEGVIQPGTTVVHRYLDRFKISVAKVNFSDEEGIEACFTFSQNSSVYFDPAFFSSGRYTSAPMGSNEFRRTYRLLQDEHLRYNLDVDFRFISNFRLNLACSENIRAAQDYAFSNFYSIQETAAKGCVPAASLFNTDNHSNLAILGCLSRYSGQDLIKLNSRVISFAAKLGGLITQMENFIEMGMPHLACLCAVDLLEPTSALRTFKQCLLSKTTLSSKQLLRSGVTTCNPRIENMLFAGDLPDVVEVLAELKKVYLSYFCCDDERLDKIKKF